MRLLATACIALAIVFVLQNAASLPPQPMPHLLDPSDPADARQMVHALSAGDDRQRQTTADAAPVVADKPPQRAPELDFPEADEPPQPGPDSSELAGSNHRCFAMGALCVSWALHADSVRFTLKGHTTGYVALGFPDVPGRMWPADCFVCYVAQAGGAKVFDGFMRDYNAPDVSEPQDVTLVDAHEVNGVTECTVERAIVSMDPSDRNLTVTSPTEVVWALSGQDDLYSQHDRKGGGRIELR